MAESDDVVARAAERLGEITGRINALDKDLERIERRVQDLERDLDKVHERVTAVEGSLNEQRAVNVAQQARQNVLTSRGMLYVTAVGVFISLLSVLMTVLISTGAFH